MPRPASVVMTGMARRSASRRTSAWASAATEPPPESAVEKPATKKATKPRLRNPLFDSIAEVSGLDSHTAGDLIGLVSAKLAAADPPFTPDDVRTFARRFHELCPYAARDKRPRPTPKEIEKNIGLIRAGKPTGQADSNQSATTNLDKLREMGMIL